MLLPDRRAAGDRGQCRPSRDPCQLPRRDGQHGQRGSGHGRRRGRAIAALDRDLIMFSMPDAEIVRAARKVGLRVLTLFLADRAYDENANLVSRKLPNSVITSPEAVAEAGAAVSRQRHGGDDRGQVDQGRGALDPRPQRYAGIGQPRRHRAPRGRAGRRRSRSRNSVTWLKVQYYRYCAWGCFRNFLSRPSGCGPNADDRCSPADDRAWLRDDCIDDARGR